MAYCLWFNGTKPAQCKLAKCTPWMALMRIISKSCCVI